MGGENISLTPHFTDEETEARMLALLAKGHAAGKWREPDFETTLAHALFLKNCVIKSKEKCVLSFD